MVEKAIDQIYLLSMEQVLKLPSASGEG